MQKTIWDKKLINLKIERCSEKTGYNNNYQKELNNNSKLLIQANNL